jgi:hypothetical protein
MIAFLSNLSFTEISLTVILLVLVGLLIRVQLKKDGLDLRWLILDDTTKQPSIHKIGQCLALSVSTWGFVVLTTKGLLTEFYFTGYMTIWAGAVAIDKLLTRKDDRKDEDK